MKFFSSNSNFWAAALVIVGAILFSTKAVVIKLAYQYPVDSISLLSLRMLFALPFFVGLAFLNFSKQPTAPIQRRDWWAMLGVGVLGFYCASYLDFLGLQYISASLERMVLYVYPTLVLLLSALLFKKKITRIQLAALLITYVGIGLIFAGQSNPAGNSNIPLGALLVFGAALTYAMYLVGSGQLLPRIGTRRFTAYSMMAAATVVLAHYGLTHGVGQLFEFSWQVYALALFMAVFATFIPTLMISEGIRILGANNAAIIGAIGPVSTIVLAYFFLNERLLPRQLLGTVIVIGGILVITLLNNRSKAIEKSEV